MRSGKTDAVQNKTLYSFMHSWHDPIACQPRAQPAEGTPSGVSADAEGYAVPAAFTAGIQLHIMHSWRNWIACQPPTLKVVGSIPGQYPKYTRNARLENIGKCRILKVLQGIKK